ncbi:MAG: polysaccharide lyase family protein, partial [Phycisphaerae bacterium]
MRSMYVAAAMVAAVGVAGRMGLGAITITQTSNSNWTISNGALSVVYNPAKEYITSLKVGNSSTNILNPAKSLLYPELAGTPFGSGAQTYSYSLAPDGSYIDFSTTVASQGSATNSNGTLINPLTYSFHYVMYNNDPSISCYEVVSHAATDPATSVGQGQFLLRVNPTLITNTYQVDTGVNNPGVQAAPMRNQTTLSSVAGQAGRNVQDATTDLTGSGLAGDFGTNFATKYDYSSYEQLHQGQVEWGSQYALATVIPNHDTMTGGPTKQNLQFTDTILMQEFLSGHYGDPKYGYTMGAGQVSSRLFGPFVFRVTNTNGESGAQLYNDAVSTIPTWNQRYDSEQTLIANGYVTSSQRGSFQVTVGNAGGWTSNVNGQTVVLSDPRANFQESHQGYQYWGQIGANGTANISGIVPGTYRMSIYQLGQWGETRVDGVTVAGGKLTIPTGVTFKPENFSTAAPVWTIGTPDRSANEFLNGHNASGGDIRAYQGSYDYWAEEQALGNPGKVVYYATAVGTHGATNDPNKWIANQWQKFNPGMYDAANSTTDNYSNLAPQYVKDAGGPGSYTGAPWEVHFVTTQGQLDQGQYAVLSVGLGAEEASLIVTLNGHQEIWHGANPSDPMVRSGVAGFYQWLAFEFPTSDLKPAGQENVITFGVSASWGVMYDALRLEITNKSASPGVTGWHDYEYITGSNSQTAADSTIGLGETQLQGTALAGDANLDGQVDLTDLSVVLNHFGEGTGSWLEGNFHGGATVDLTDLSDVLDHFGEGSGGAAAGGRVAAVP